MQCAERPSWCIGWLVGIILLAHLGMLAHQAWNDSPTLDEPGHLIAAIGYWRLQRTDLFCVNPPLVRCLAGLPSLFFEWPMDWHGCTPPPMRPEFTLGGRFFEIDATRGILALRLGRLMCLPISVLGALTCYLWTRDLYGSRAGVVGLLLWCICPNILAHGHLITSDLAATSLALVASYVFWKWLNNPTWELTLTAGIALGFSELTKFTLIIFYPLWCVLLLLCIVRNFESMRQTGKRAARFLILVIISLVFINSFYGFRGTGQPMRERNIAADIIRSSRHAGAFALIDRALLDSGVPIPLPCDYVTGIYVQRLDLENGRRSFLFGQWRDKGGWWYYYLVCLGLKTPIGVLVLFFVSFAVAIACRVRLNWFDELCLFAPGILILAFVSSQMGYNHHLRYVLPAAPFFYIAASKCVRFATWRGFRAVLVISLVWSFLSSAWCLPHSLSYFNEFAGGPHNGYEFLSNSNTEWAQDFLYLKDWLTRNGVVEPIHLHYTIPSDPNSLGVDVVRGSIWPCDRETPRRGWYALSVHILQGDNADRLIPYPPTAYAGYSIRIYRIDNVVQPTRDYATGQQQERPHD